MKTRRSKPWPERYPGHALITGASSGIGEAFARKLAGLGKSLVLVARRHDALEALAQTLRESAAVDVVVVPLDLTAPGAAVSLKEHLDRAGVEVGLLINNAGFGLYGSFAEGDLAMGLKSIELNCLATVALTGIFLPAMLARGCGAIVVVASMAGFQPTPYFAVYGATKAFDLMFAEALACEVKAQGIDVVALCPGYTPTGFQRVAGSEETLERGPVTSVDDVVDAAIEGLGRRVTVIPGSTNRLMNFAVRLAPRRTVAKAAARALRPKR